MKYLIFGFLALTIFSCCRTAEPLTLDRMDYVGNEIRIDGYYYHQLGDVFHPFVLFENGVYMSCGFVDEINEISQIDSLIKDQEFIDRLGLTQYGWGVFKIVSDKIEIERWLPGSVGPYPVQLLGGDILNDDTILISGLRGTKYEDEVDTFKFRHLSSKPDSTNMFIP